MLDNHTHFAIPDAVKSASHVFGEKVIAPSPQTELTTSRLSVEAQVRVANDPHGRTRSS